MINEYFTVFYNHGIILNKNPKKNIKIQTNLNQPELTQNFGKSRPITSSSGDHLIHIIHVHSTEQPTFALHTHIKLNKLLGVWKIVFSHGNLRNTRHTVKFDPLMIIF